MRKRLRSKYSTDEYALLYAEQWDGSMWLAHSQRIAATIEMASRVEAESAADLSCGDGQILRTLSIPDKYYGDFAPGWAFQGLIDQTIHQIPTVDLFILSETLEHLDDPDGTLRLVRPKARQLLVSTPIDAFDDGNWEHYWAWDREAVEAMLSDTGWTVKEFDAVDTRPDGYLFGIWRAE